MKKTIGFVCEGPRDSDLFKKVIQHLFPNDKFQFLYLQPELDASSQYMAGWKGVWRWCFENGKQIEELITNISPALDMLIIHMDGDVSRKEKESHCECLGNDCPYYEETLPPVCQHYDECPVLLPCSKHNTTPQTYVSHLKNILVNLFPEKISIPIIITIPCDSTDTWIVAALDDYESYEELIDPWEQIISKKKFYHNIKITKKKTKNPYNDLIDLMIPLWEERVIIKSEQANHFHNELITNIK